VHHSPVCLLVCLQVGMDSPGPSYSIPAALGKQQVGGLAGVACTEH
jgi:hypothetical protein